MSRHNSSDTYPLAQPMKLIQGVVVGHRDGYGFVIPDDKQGDLFLSVGEMRSVLHGDRVAVHVSDIDRQGRRRGRVVEVLERTAKTLVGRYVLEPSRGVVVPEDPRILQRIVIPAENSGKAHAGDMVEVRLITPPTRHFPPTGQIVAVLGREMSPALAVEIAIRSHQIPHTWPEAVEAEVKAIAPCVDERSANTRVDLRHLPFVTIDGADAKDFDDAVYCEHRPMGWRLWVAIADVSAYVPVGSALDVEARRRGTSTYFPGRVVPMLPEALSNGLCSLHPQTDRLCIACDMSLNPEGRIVRSRFVEAVIRSRARLTYDEVTQVLVGDEIDPTNQAEALRAELTTLCELYEVLHAAQKKRGGVEFTIPEAVIYLTSDGVIESIAPQERALSHRIIEQCMIAANVAAARYIERHRIPALYRVHTGPGAQKLSELRHFLHSIGLSLSGGGMPSSADYAAVLVNGASREDAHILPKVLLRSLPQAVYQPINAGHFSLALDSYCHFTSPIRRYPDLVLHRAIRYRLREGGVGRCDTGAEDGAVLGQHTSMTERRAEQSVREAIAWFKCEFMGRHVGEIFSGVISGTTSFGLFVTLDAFCIDGLLHISELGDDDYHHDPREQTLIGAGTHEVYRLGDRVQVRLVKVDSRARRIDFALVSLRPPRHRQRRGRFGSKGRLRRDRRG